MLILEESYPYISQKNTISIFSLIIDCLIFLRYDKYMGKLSLKKIQRRDKKPTSSLPGDKTDLLTQFGPFSNYFDILKCPKFNKKQIFHYDFLKGTLI